MDAVVAVGGRGVYKLIGEDEAGYADSCDTEKGDEISLGIEA
jgi:hypothetical protein